MTYTKKLMFMMKLENRSLGIKMAWLFSWIFIPALFKEEFGSEYTFRKNMDLRWKK